MKNKRKVIVGVSIVMVLILCLCVIFISKNNQQQVINNQIEQNVNGNKNGITKLNITQNVDGLEFSNVEIQMKTDRDCELTAEVLNTTEEMVEAHTIRIRISDDAGELNEVFAGNVSSIPAGGKGTLNSTLRKDLTSATNVKFEIIE